MVCSTLLCRVPHVWRITLLGAGASVPAAVVLDWLPNADATVGGAMMIVGASIGGGLAATRSVDPGAVGLRAGFLGGVVAALRLAGTVGTTAAWSGSRLFAVFAGVVVVCVSPVFGWLFGHLGGRVATAVAR